MLNGLSKKTLIGLTIASLLVSYWIVAIHFENESNYYNNDNGDDSKRETVILEQNNNGTSGNNTVNMGLVKLLPRLTPYTIFDWIKQSIGLMLIFIVTFIVISVVFMTLFMITSSCIIKRIEKKLKVGSFVRINDDSVY
jgi:hypothetical protein